MNIEELEPPHTVHTATRAQELARIWIVDKQQHVSINGHLWENPWAWGMMLVDLAKHVAEAYAQQGWDKEEALARVLQGFQAELESPTDTPKPLS